MGSRLFNTAEAARLLSLHVQTVRRYCREHIIEASSVSAGSGRGNRYRISLAAVEAFQRLHGRF